MGKQSLRKTRMAILASGNGTNAERLIRHFADSELAEVVCVMSDNPQSGVLQRAHNLGVPTQVLPRKVYNDGEAFLAQLQAAGADFVILAGYLKLIPARVVTAFPKSLVNIHPALLPKFGGKGMYGMHVHEAVIAAGEKWSGITIHYVNEVYDAGEVIHQESLRVQPDWSAADLAHAIHQLEYQHFPRTLELLLRQRRDLDASLA